MIDLSSHFGHEHCLVLELYASFQSICAHFILTDKLGLSLHVKLTTPEKAAGLTD